MKKQLKKSNKSISDEIDDPLSHDLSSFIKEGGWENIQFELKEKKNKVVSLRLSEKLFQELQHQAKSLGLDTQKFIRIALESVVRKKA